MKKMIFFLLIPTAIFFSCNSDSAINAQKEKDSYELMKEGLLKKEQKDPASFLSVAGSNRKNIFGQTVVRGNITNKSTMAIFKDIELKLSFYSRTRALLETDKETIFDVLHPGENKNFKTKYFAPKGTDSVGLEVVGAKLFTSDH